MNKVNRLYLILGDQLSFDLASLQGLDRASDAVLMVEVMEEASHVPHHPQKIVLIFSAMRHFAKALQARGVRVEYVTLEDPNNSGSVPAELRRWHALLQPAELHVTECGDWRLEQSLKECGVAIDWHADTRFLCSRAEFSAWAAGKKQLRMEFFYREMRRKSRLLINGDGTPVGGAWNFDAENRKALPKGVKAPTRSAFPQTPLPAKYSRWSNSASATTTVSWMISTIRLPTPTLNRYGITFWITAWPDSAITRTPWPTMSRFCFMRASVLR